jgi:hypothetical protein
MVGDSDMKDNVDIESSFPVILVSSLFMMAAIYWGFGIYSTFVKGVIPGISWSTDHKLALGTLWVIVVGAGAYKPLVTLVNISRSIALIRAGTFYLPLFYINAIFQAYSWILIITAWFDQILPLPFIKVQGGMSTGIILLMTVVPVLAVFNYLTGRLLSGVHSAFPVETGLFSRKQYLKKEDFAAVINALILDFETTREEYVFGSFSTLKREGADVSETSHEIISNGELENILRGFQLTAVIGIAWEQIKNIKDMQEFGEMLTNQMKAEKGTQANTYRDKYIKCQGDMDCLAKALSDDINRIMGLNLSEKQLLNSFHSGAYYFIGVCQMNTYARCGNKKMADEVRKKIGKEWSKPQ